LIVNHAPCEWCGLNNCISVICLEKLAKIDEAEEKQKREWENYSREIYGLGVERI